MLEDVAGGRLQALDPPRFTRDDLYRDALPALDLLRARGTRAAIAGNFSRPAAEDVAGWDLPVEAVVSAEDLGVEKPDPEFFRALAAELRVTQGELLYVGDRLDNDVFAATAAGCRSVWIRRGPWALIQGRGAAADGVEVVDDLPAVAHLV